MTTSPAIPGRHTADLQIAAAIAGGDRAGWHRFVQQYSGLIFSIVLRYFADGDEDEHRNAYVSILEHLYRSGIEKYDGRSSLGSWVVTVSRSRCLDMLRSRDGRKRPPRWLRRMPARHQQIYRLHFVQGRDFESVAAEFEQRGDPLTIEEFVDALDRIEAKMDRRLRTRMAYDLRARSIGVKSGRMLEFVDQLRIEQEAAAEAQRPDYEEFSACTRETLRSIRILMARLDAQEREVVRLHFFDELPAARVAQKLGLRNQRRVYTVLSRALRTLREKLEDMALTGGLPAASRPPVEPTSLEEAGP